MAGGIGPWEIYWDRMWVLGLENRLGPKGQDYVWEKYGRFIEPPDEPIDFDDPWEYDPSP